MCIRVQFSLINPSLLVLAIATCIIIIFTIGFYDSSSGTKMFDIILYYSYFVSI